MNYLLERIDLTSHVDPIYTGRKNTMAQCTMNDRTKRIRATSEAAFNAKYILGGDVMGSTHAGMRVLWGTRLKDGMEVVVKVRSRANSFKTSAEEREWRATTEVQLNMPPTATICQLLEVVQTKQRYYIVMEKVQGKDLCEHMEDGDVQQRDTREVVYQILEALKFLHSKGRIHKDLKLENVMVNMNAERENTQGSESGECTSSSPCSPGASKSMTSWSSEGSLASSLEVKLIDFDTVEDWQPQKQARTVLGSNGYIAPEAYLGEYSPASDIFCVGVIMYKLLTQQFPYNLDLFDDLPGQNKVGSSAMKRIHARLKNEQVDFGCFPFCLSPEAADLCSQMLSFDAQQRPSAEEALNHIWFQLLLEEINPQQSKVNLAITPAPRLQFPTTSVGLPDHA